MLDSATWLDESYPEHPEANPMVRQVAEITVKSRLSISDPRRMVASRVASLRHAPLIHEVGELMLPVTYGSER